MFEKSHFQKTESAKTSLKEKAAKLRAKLEKFGKTMLVGSNQITKKKDKSSGLIHAFSLPEHSYLIFYHHSAIQSKLKSFGVMIKESDFVQGMKKAAADMKNKVFYSCYFRKSIFCRSTKCSRRSRTSLDDHLSKTR